MANDVYFPTTILWPKGKSWFKPLQRVFCFYVLMMVCISCRLGWASVDGFLERRVPLGSSPGWVSNCGNQKWMNTYIHIQQSSFATHKLLNGRKTVGRLRRTEPWLEFASWLLRAQTFWRIQFIIQWIKQTQHSNLKYMQTH